MDLASLAAAIRADPGVLGKRDIQAACAELGLDGGAPGQPGDDCAVLPDGDSYALFATEGFINRFVEVDPWFAGWCGVMVNLSDVLAMGGRATAVTNALWAPSIEAARPVIAGMRAAAEAYGIPIVGGHTNLRTPQLQLSVSILGRARALISSFAARPGEVLIAAIDQRGAYRAPFDNWQAALDAPPDRLRADAEILPRLAEDGLVRAGKDISQGGLVGTAIMLAECSGVGLEIAPGEIPLPDGVDLPRWLRSFPSFGFLLCARAEDAAAVVARFASRDVAAAVIGRVVPGSVVALTHEGATVPVWDHAAHPYLGLARKEPTHA